VKSKDAVGGLAPSAPSTLASKPASLTFIGRLRGGHRPTACFVGLSLPGLRPGQAGCLGGRGSSEADGDWGKTPSLYSILSPSASLGVDSVEGDCVKTPSLHSILSENEARRAE